MIVERNNKLTTQGKRKLTINCGTIQVLKWIVVEVEHWNWLLEKRNINVEAKSHE